MSNPELPTLNPLDSCVAQATYGRFRISAAKDRRTGNDNLRAGRNNSRDILQIDAPIDLYPRLELAVLDQSVLTAALCRLRLHQMNR